MYIKKLSANQHTSFMISRMLYETHIYNNLDDNMLDVWGAHQFLTEIENGSRLVWGGFSDEESKFLGCVHGKIVDGFFEAHVLFKRNINAFDACSTVEKLLKEHCKKNNIHLRGIKGFIANDNRAAIILSKKIGCRDAGVKKDIFFRAGNDIPCRIMIKEYDNV